MYKIDDELFKTEYDAAEYILNSYRIEDIFDSFLDETYGEVKIGNCYYDTSWVLKKIDCGQYDDEFNDWKNYEYDYIVEELKNMAFSKYDYKKIYYDLFDVEYEEKEVLLNDSDKSIKFLDLNEAKKYFIEIAKNDDDFLEEIMDADDFDDLCRVVNIYSKDYNDDSKYFVEII